MCTKQGMIKLKNRKKNQGVPPHLDSRRSRCHFLSWAYQHHRHLLVISWPRHLPRSTEKINRDDTKRSAHAIPLFHTLSLKSSQKRSCASNSVRCKDGVRFISTSSFCRFSYHTGTKPQHWWLFPAVLSAKRAIKSSAALLSDCSKYTFQLIYACVVLQSSKTTRSVDVVSVLFEGNWRGFVNTCPDSVKLFMTCQKMLQISKDEVWMIHYFCPVRSGSWIKYMVSFRGGCV